MNVTASDIGAYSFCPRTLYLRRVVGLSEPEGDRAIFEAERRRAGRAISLSHPFIMQHAVAFGKGPKRIIEELFKRPMSQEVRDWSLSRILTLCREFSSMADQLGEEEAMEMVSPIRTAFRTGSPSFGISAAIDRLMPAPPNSPVLIRCGDFQSFWENDAVQAAAAAMALEASIGYHISHSFIEPVGAFMSHPVSLDAALREKVLIARAGAERILAGELPSACPHGNPRKCAGCLLEDECYLV